MTTIVNYKEANLNIFSDILWDFYYVQKLENFLGISLELTYETTNPKVAIICCPEYNQKYLFKFLTNIYEEQQNMFEYDKIIFKILIDF